MPLEEPALQAIASLCERLSERMAVLFLGAGVNAGSRDDTGSAFPLGQDLSDWLSRDLLQSPTLSSTLDEAAEMVRFRLGDQLLNGYLYVDSHVSDQALRICHWSSCLGTSSTQPI